MASASASTGIGLSVTIFRLGVAVFIVESGQNPLKDITTEEMLKELGNEAANALAWETSSGRGG